MISIEKYAAYDRFGKKCPEILVKRLKKLTNDIKTHGLWMHHGRMVLTGYAYQELYDWDLYFENIFLSYFGVSQYCRNGVEMFLDEQEPSGFVPRTMGIVHQKLRHQFKPFLAQIALLGSRQSNDFRWLSGKYYEKLQNYLQYWFWYCDADKNGLCFWDSADHSGMDNQCRRAGDIGQMEMEGVDLNVYLVREWDAMEQIALALDKREDAKAFAAKSIATMNKIESFLWNEKEGFYFDRSEKTGVQNELYSIAGLLPLWLGKIPQYKAERLVREHLLDPQKFATPYPVATWGKNNADYYQERHGEECNWMGTTWIPTNYMIFHGLMRHGFMEEAKHLAEKTYELVVSEAETREYYNGESGAGQGLNPFWGWSALGLLMPAEYELRYDPTDILRTQFKEIDLAF